jgi:hypothetical protein
MEIGGDWYDAFRLPDGKLAVAAGDVMGKGLTAAAGMGRVRNALRALALTDPRPAAVLAGLDRLFIATELEEQVTTVAYLVLDPASGDGMACCRSARSPGWTRRRRARRWAGPARASSTPSGCRPATPRCCIPTGWWKTAGAAWTRAWTSWSRWPGRLPAKRWKIRPCCWSTWWTGC